MRWPICAWFTIPMMILRSKRVVNLPARGIGERTVALVRDRARQHGQSLVPGPASALCQSGGFSARAGNAMAAFLALGQ